MALLFQGAESKIWTTDYLGKTMLVKERFVKKYRNKELDHSLTRERIKAECRNILRCKQAGILTPAIYFVDLEKRLIYMEYLAGSVTVKEVIEKLQNSNDTISLHNLLKKIGNNLGKMHMKDIAHGDLTSSNMLVVEGNLYFIDFGLSSSNVSSEEKGVDLYVLERALISTHANMEILFPIILDSYKMVTGKRQTDTLSKYEEVRARGRKRTMVG